MFERQCIKSLLTPKSSKIATMMAHASTLASHLSVQVQWQLLVLEDNW
jgi:hypothetical protein